MKLVELSKRAIQLLQDAGEKGVSNLELAETLSMPRRRVYDIVATLKAAGLVEAKREKGGTRIFWETIPSIESAPAPKEDNKTTEKLKSKIDKLTTENKDLQDKIKRLREDTTSKAQVKKTSKKQMFDTSEVIIRAAKSFKIAEVVSSGIEVNIKATGKGIIVEPMSED